MITAKSIDNYIGGNTDPFKLASDMFSQVSKSGAKYTSGNVVSIDSYDDKKKVTLSNGQEYFAKTIIFAIVGKLNQPSNINLVPIMLLPYFSCLFKQILRHQLDFSLHCKVITL